MKNIIKPGLFSNSVLKVILIMVILVMAVMALNSIIFPQIGFRISYNSGKPGIDHIIRYSNDESRILNILIKDTVVLNEIPQSNYLISQTGMEEGRLRDVLRSLDENGDIVLDESGMIVEAYPWSSRETGIAVYLSPDSQSAAGPFKAVGALYAMSVIPLFESNGRIVGKLDNQRGNLLIEIENDEIVYTNMITAVVYRTDDYRNSRFFVSPDEARDYYSDGFELNRVIRLDRALLIGDIIAKEIKEKME